VALEVHVAIILGLKRCRDSVAIWLKPFLVLNSQFSFFSTFPLMARRLLSVTFATLLLGAAALRRKSDSSKQDSKATDSGDVAVQGWGCEHHTGQLRPGWMIKCGTGLDYAQSVVASWGNSAESVADCQRRCELAGDKCEGFEVLQNIGHMCMFFIKRIPDDPSTGLCFKKLSIPFAWQAVFYKESMPVKGDGQCFEGAPNSCEEHQERLRPGWKLECDTGIDWDMSNIEAMVIDSSDFVQCQQRCEARERCLGFVARSAPIIPGNHYCSLFMEKREETPVSTGLCLKQYNIPTVTQNIFFKEGVVVKKTPSECEPST